MFIVPVVGADELHVPPVTAFVYEAVAPVHNDDTPVIEPASAVFSTVNRCVANDVPQLVVTL